VTSLPAAAIDMPPAARRAALASPEPPVSTPFPQSAPEFSPSAAPFPATPPLPAAPPFPIAVDHVGAFDAVQHREPALRRELVQHRDAADIYADRFPAPQPSIAPGLTTGYGAAAAHGLQAFPAPPPAARDTAFARLSDSSPVDRIPATDRIPAAEPSPRPAAAAIARSLQPTIQVSTTSAGRLLQTPISISAGYVPPVEPGPPPIDIGLPAAPPAYPDIIPQSGDARSAAPDAAETFALFHVPVDAGARLDLSVAARIGLPQEPSPLPLAPEDVSAPAPSLALGFPIGGLEAPLSPLGAGLDDVPKAAGPKAPYAPRALADIRPYHSYSPEGVALCPDPTARCPELRPLPDTNQLAERVYPQIDFLWAPSNIFYSPLYFEDPYLERYGHSHGPLLQPLASTSRFALQFVSLPYQMALDPPHRRVYPLGFYRPGECAPKQLPTVPLNGEAAVKAGAVYTGLIFAFP